MLGLVWAWYSFLGSYRTNGCHLQKNHDFSWLVTAYRRLKTPCPNTFRTFFLFRFPLRPPLYDRLHFRFPVNASEISNLCERSCKHILEQHFNGCYVSFMFVFEWVYFCSVIYEYVVSRTVLGFQINMVLLFRKCLFVFICLSQSFLTVVILTTQKVHLHKTWIYHMVYLCLCTVQSSLLQIHVSIRFPCGLLKCPFTPFNKYCHSFGAHVYIPDFLKYLK